MMSFQSLERAVPKARFTGLSDVIRHMAVDFIGLFSFLNNFLKICFYYFVCVCLCTTSVPNAEEVVSLHMGAGNRTQILCKNSSGS